MLKINHDTPKIPLNMRMKVNKAKKELKKSGYDNFDVKVNKQGTTAILGYKTPEHDELVISNVIKPDGRQLITTYKTFPEKRKYKEPYTKIIETYDKQKDGSGIFNKRVTMRYNGFSKIPEMLSMFKT